MANRQVLKMSIHHSSCSRSPSTKSSLIISSTLVLVLLSVQCVIYGSSQLLFPRDNLIYSTFQDSKDAADSNSLDELLNELEKGKFSKATEQLALGDKYQVDNRPDLEYSSNSFSDYFLPATDSPQHEVDFSGLTPDSRWSPPVSGDTDLDQQLDTYDDDDDNSNNQLLSNDLLSYLADQVKLAENNLAESGKNFYQLDEEEENHKRRTSAPFTTLIDEEPKALPDNATLVQPAKTAAALIGGEAGTANKTTTNSTHTTPETRSKATQQPAQAPVEPKQPEVSKWSITSLFQAVKQFLHSKLSWSAKPIGANSTDVSSLANNNTGETNTVSLEQPDEPTKPSSISVPTKKIHPRNNKNIPKVVDSASVEEPQPSLSPRSNGHQMEPSSLMNDDGDEDDGDDRVHQMRLVQDAGDKLVTPHQQVSASSLHGLPRVSLLRQSSLTPPLYLDEQLVVHSSTPQMNTLSSQFVNVEQPSRQYRMSSGSSSRAIRPQLHDGNYDNSDADNDVDDIKTMFADEPPHHSTYLSRLRAGDHIFGPYRSYYDHRHPESAPGLNLMANKSNDIYFLVMVVAFCAMAIAVVLSASLFTYRIQQNRKTNSDQDYPTYGVVGPNNMTGKCGPAAFVGGYFGNQAGPLGGSSVSTSKSPKGGPPEYGDSGVEVSGSRTGSSKSSTNQAAGVANSMNVTANNRSVSGFMVDNQSAARMYHYQHQKQQMIISDKNSAGRHTSASDLDSEDENDDGSYTVYECPGLASAHEMEIKNPLFNDDQTP